jgi:hypothetical protein
MSSEPSYPAAGSESMDERRDEAPPHESYRGTGTEPQGSHGAAGGRPEHHEPGGGASQGHSFPPGWPEYRSRS